MVYEFTHLSQARKLYAFQKLTVPIRYNTTQKPYILSFLKRHHVHCLCIWITFSKVASYQCCNVLSSQVYLHQGQQFQKHIPTHIRVHTCLLHKCKHTCTHLGSQSREKLGTHVEILSKFSQKRGKFNWIVEDTQKFIRQREYVKHFQVRRKVG